MIEQDTIRLLRECDVGIKMGVKSIDDCLGYAKSGEMKSALKECKRRHDRLDTELCELLDKYGDRGKDPNPMITGMSTIKTNMKLTINHTDSQIADLIVDGCNMGIKSLSKYLNQYGAASEVAKDITKKLIKEEEELSVKMRDFL